MSKGKFYHNRNNNKNRPRFHEDSLQSAVALNGNAKREDLSRPIEDLQLSEGTFNALKAGRINTLADLACRSFSQMFRIQNIGKKNCIEISNALQKFGISFAKDASATDNGRRDNRGQRDGASQGGRDRNRGDRFDAGAANRERRNNDRNDFNKNKNKGENAQLNDYLSRLYAGMSWSEILMGKRERPAVERVERPPLTETSLVKFCRKGKWGYKDWKGNVVVPPQYEEAFGFAEERGCVEMDGKLGYIDRKNNLVIDYKFDCATSFSEGLASVTVGEKSGYIDVDGNQIVDFIYDVATPFFGGKAIVRADERWGVLNRETLSVFWR